MHPSNGRSPGLGLNSDGMPLHVPQTQLLYPPYGEHRTCPQSVGLPTNLDTRLCSLESLDPAYTGRSNALDGDESCLVDDEVEDDDSVEVYVWNELLGTYVLLPESVVADEIEGRAEVESAARALPITESLNSYSSPGDHVLPLDNAQFSPLPSSSFLSSSLELHSLPLPHPPPFYPSQPGPLSIVIEETDSYQRDIDDLRDPFAPSILSTPCSMLSGFTYTSPHAAWDPSLSVADVEDDTQIAAQHIDSLGNAGYSRSFLQGLQSSSRRLSRGIDTATRELLGRIRRLVRSR